MSGDPIVYRSADPSVVKAWNEACAEIYAYVTATQAVLDEAGLGRYKVYRHTSGWSPGRFAGLAIQEGWSPPAGWRMSGSGTYAVPDKRLKAGKQVTAALDAVKHPGGPLLKLIGMPPDTASGRGFTSPQVRMMEDGAALYVIWRTDPDRRESFFRAGQVAVDRGLWQRVKLSGYYAEVERAGPAAEADPPGTAGAA